MSLEIDNISISFIYSKLGEKENGITFGLMVIILLLYG